jgi:hypothetical protein
MGKQRWEKHQNPWIVFDDFACDGRRADIPTTLFT